MAAQSAGGVTSAMRSLHYFGNAESDLIAETIVECIINYESTKQLSLLIDRLFDNVKTMRFNIVNSVQGHVLMSSNLLEIGRVVFNGAEASASVAAKAVADHSAILTTDTDLTKYADLSKASQTDNCSSFFCIPIFYEQGRSYLDRLTISTNNSSSHRRGDVDSLAYFYTRKGSGSCMGVIIFGFEQSENTASREADLMAGLRVASNLQAGLSANKLLNLYTQLRAISSPDVHTTWGTAGGLLLDVDPEEEEEEEEDRNEPTFISDDENLKNFTSSGASRLTTSTTGRNDIHESNNNSNNEENSRQLLQKSTNILRESTKYCIKTLKSSRLFKSLFKPKIESRQQVSRDSNIVTFLFILDTIARFVYSSASTINTTSSNEIIYQFGEGLSSVSLLGLLILMNATNWGRQAYRRHRWAFINLTIIGCVWHCMMSGESTSVAQFITLPSFFKLSILRPTLIWIAFVGLILQPVNPMFLSTLLFVECATTVTYKLSCHEQNGAYLINIVEFWLIYAIPTVFTVLFIYSVSWYQRVQQHPQHPRSIVLASGQPLGG